MDSPSIGADTFMVGVDRLLVETGPVDGCAQSGAELWIRPAIIIPINFHLFKIFTGPPPLKIKDVAIFSDHLSGTSGMIVIPGVSSSSA